MLGNTVTVFVLEAGGLRKLVVDFQSFDSFAGLVPPPLVDLSFGHPSLVSDLDDFLARP